MTRFAPVSLLLFVLSAGSVFSQDLPDSLSLFKNYIVTGDYAVAGIGLRGQGDGSGFARNTITMSSVPAGADVVAAFLYWETIEKTATASAAGGFFRGYAITGKAIGNDHAAPCWSSGGATGAAQGAPTLRVYRADVRNLLPVVNGKRQAAGTFEVRLPDSGSNGAGAPLTEGASLVVVFRVLSPNFPLKAVVIYDGAWTMNRDTPYMSQSIRGFYQAAAPANAANSAKITHIVGDGQTNFNEQLLFQGDANGYQPLFRPIDGPALDPNNPFTGRAGASWDNPTFDVTGRVAQDASVVYTKVLPVDSSFDCLSWGAIVFSTLVQSSDGDGLLDTWKTSQGYTDAKDGSWVALPGARRGAKDIFVEIDYLKTADHSHLPKKAALDKVGDAYQRMGYQLHFDVGNNYQDNLGAYVMPYTAPPGLWDGRGGNAIDESAAVCQDTPSKLCQFPGQQGVISWKGGFSYFKNQPLNYPDESSCAANANCVRRFARARAHSYHYVLFGHVLGLPSTIWNIAAGTLVSIVDSGTTATVTTAAPHLLVAGSRVSVSGAISDFHLNRTYLVQTTPSATTFTITTANVTDGTYSAPREPGLAVTAGNTTSTSGWSDFGGGDSFVTLGRWRSDDPLDDKVGSVTVQAGTLAHELGHTLGGTHGGFSFKNAPADYWPSFEPNCKANYQSVMNYLFQVRGLPGGAIAFSDRILPALDERALSEAGGIGAGAPYATRWYAPLNFLDRQIQNATGGRAASRHCDGTPVLTGELQMVRIEGPGTPGIDWNGDGVISASTLILGQDINFNGSSADAALTGFSDTGFDLRQTGARRNALGFSTGAGSEDIVGGGSEDIVGGGSEDIVGGGSEDIVGGGSEDIVGGGEMTFELANADVDPPVGLTATVSGRSVTLNWSAPAFGQIRSYSIWRADVTKNPMSTTNPPAIIRTLTGSPLPTTFTDTGVKNNAKYTYYVTSALGDGTTSGPSNLVTVQIN